MPNRNLPRSLSLTSDQSTLGLGNGRLEALSDGILTTLLTIVVFLVFLVFLVFQSALVFRRPGQVWRGVELTES
jgi:hypothetical protein